MNSEVALQHVDISTLLGAPFILQSDNGSKFCGLNSKWSMEDHVIYRAGFG